MWSGSLWSVAIWVAPTLFYSQNDRHLAGILAARLFSIETYVGIAVAALAVVLPARSRFRLGLFRGRVAVRERVDAETCHERGARAWRGAVLSFGAWHGVAALVYLAACIAVAVLVWNEDFR